MTELTPPAPARPLRPREVAWRVFAHELTASAHQERGEGEKATTHVLTPLGARVSRVLLVGTLSQIEPLGDGPNPLWRARWTDPTGGLSVTAGGYQPRAMAFLSRARAPLRVCIVGKAHQFMGREGVPLVSVRAEVIAGASEDEERRWVVDTARQTLRRIALVKELQHERANGAPASGLDLNGFPRRLIDSARSISGRYPGSDPESFRPSVEAALRAVSVPVEGAVARAAPVPS